MATKAELATAHARHAELLTAASAREKSGEFSVALHLAVESLPTLRDAITFSRRFLKVEPLGPPAVDRVLRLAPPLFARSAIDAVDAEWAGWRKADRANFPDLPDRIAAAHRAMADTARLWSDLAAGRATIPPNHTAFAVWVAMGAAVAVGPMKSSQGRSVTDLRRDASGKCSNCGHELRAAMASLLDPRPCPACRQVTEFVVVRRCV